MYTYKLRRDLAVRWETVNPVLDQGEPGFEIDTGRMKVGDGIKAWAALPYLSGSEGVPSIVPWRNVSAVGEPVFGPKWGQFAGGEIIAFRKVGDMVQVKGMTSNPTGAYAPNIFTLPVDCRPTSTINRASISDGLLAVISVATTGIIHQASGPTSSLDLGMTFYSPVV